MSLLKRPLVLTSLLALGLAGLISLIGGAIGNALGFGFLASPMPEISVPAEKVVSVGGYDINNSYITFWAAAVILIVISYLATRNMKMVPTGLQNFVELVVEAWIKLVESVGGPSARRFLPLVMTIFLAVLVANWIGDIPGVGTIGRIESPEEVAHHVEEGEEAPELTVFDGGGSFKYIPFGRGEDTKVALGDVNRDTGKVEVAPEGQSHLKGKDAGILIPYLRGASTDLNTPLAIAIIAMIAVQFWGFTSLGFKGYGQKFINLRQGPMFFAVGLLEILSEFVKVISFTFRLFGNMFAGEVLLITMAFLFPLIGIIPFLGLEIFVGFIQAIIFSMLTLVFAVVATSGHGEEAHH